MNCEEKKLIIKEQAKKYQRRYQVKYLDALNTICEDLYKLSYSDFIIKNKKNKIKKK